MSLDTLTIARELKAADMGEAQAEAVAAAIGRAVAEGSATKADLATIEGKIGVLEGKLDQLRIEVDAKLEKLKNEMVRWYLGGQLTIAAVIIAALKL